MDSPNPDTGEEYPHTNTQLYDILPEENRFKLGAEISAPYNAPAPGQVPTMDGFVTDYISTLTAELGRQPTYEEYSQVMTGFTPEQIPVLSGLARGFGVFDHWFCEVPSRLHQPVVLDRRHSVGIRGQRAGQQLAGAQHRRDDLQPAGAARQDLEGLRRRTGPVLRHRPDPLPPAQGPVRHPLRAVRPVRGRRRRQGPARLLLHRAVPDPGPRGLPPRRLPRPGPRHRAPRRRPAVLDPGRRGVPGPDLQRLQRHAVPGRGQHLEHDPAHRLGRTGRHLRPRSRPPRCRRRTRPPRQASSGSPSTARATGSRPSWSPRGWPKARCSTPSTGTPP